MSNYDSYDILTKLTEVYNLRLETGISYEQARTFAGDFQFRSAIFKDVDANACLQDLLMRGFIEMPYISGFKLTEKATDKF